MRSLETWTSVIHSVAEWQGRHYRGSGSQHFTWVNTVQPLAACHSLYLVDSFMKFDTLFFPWKSCKFQQSFSGWPISVKLLLSDSSVRLSWTCCQNRVNVFISLTFFFLKNYQLIFWANYALNAEMSQRSLCLLCCHQLHLKHEPVSPSNYCIDRA